MKVINLSRVVVISSILLCQSYAAEMRSISPLEDTWTLIDDLPEKKQDASLGSFVPFMVLKSDSSRSPLKAVMLEISIINTNVAKKFGILCTSQIATIISPTIFINIMLRDKSQISPLMNYLRDKTEGAYMAINNNVPYPLKVGFDMPNYSKIKGVFNELSAFLKLSDTAKLALDQTYNDLECRCRSAGYETETVKKP